MKVLGINCSLHDISVAYIEDKVLKYAIEEERLTKHKHQGGLLVGGDMPKLGLKKILTENNLLEFDYICYSGDIFFQPVQIQKECTAIHAMAKQLDLDMKKTIFLDHHLCHALASFAESNFNEAGVLVVDGEGDSCSVSIFKIAHGVIEPVYKLPPTSSLGNMYSYIVNKLGYRSFGDESKVMALSDYGTAIEEYTNIVIHYGDYLEIDWNKLKLLGNLAEQSKSFTEKANVAKTIQIVLEREMLWLTNLAVKLTNCSNICLSGGVAANGKSNANILNHSQALKVFVPHMPGDSGISIGAAVFPYFLIQDRINNFKITPYAGTEYTNETVENYLNNNRIPFQKSNNIESDAAKLLAKGQTILWFQGKMEFGARALGNRSIIAPVHIENVSYFVNNMIKHREPWRPLAPAVLLEDVNKFFVNPIESPYMCFGLKVKEEYLNTFKNVMSIDGCSMVQTVSSQTNPRFYKLIKNYGRLSGIPVVINTSFNDSDQPIVESIKDAINTFYSSPVEYLVINDFIITK